MSSNKTSGKITVDSSNLTKSAKAENPDQLKLDVSPKAKVPRTRHPRLDKEPSSTPTTKVIESGIQDLQGKDVGLVARIWNLGDGKFATQMMPARAGVVKGTAPILVHESLAEAEASLHSRTKTNLAYIRAMAKRSGGVYKTDAEVRREAAKQKWDAAQKA